ncbi:MAG: NAD(+)/NADH kinase [Firmicutes bacterium]|nr:NAD(+)/NADH kinase [Bacillota bacterium]
MNRIGLVPNWAKENTKSVVEQVSSFFGERGVKLLIAEEKEENGVGLKVKEKELREWKDKVDIVLVIGGDGTILGVARLLAGLDIPILGINVGHKGFLAEIEAQELFPFLHKILDDEYEINNRMMLKTSVFRDGQKVADRLAFNDVVVSRGPFSRIIKLDTFVNNDFLESYPGDGLIVSSPTGSTGYSLSAGGPIVNPQLNLLLITPICPHKLYSRSVIVSDKEKIRLIVRSRQAEVFLTVDGQIGFSLKGDDEVIVRKAEDEVQLVSFADNSFYKLLQRKLKVT